MHSRVFQLETIKPSKYEEESITLLKSYHLDLNQFPYQCADYWDDSENSPLEDFKLLCLTLPEDVFEINEDELSITLLKRPESYVSKFFDTIREESAKLNLSDFVEFKCNTWKLERLLRLNDCYSLIYRDSYGNPIYMHDWLLELAQSGTIGTKYYLGGVIDYHW